MCVESKKKETEVISNARVEFENILDKISPRTLKRNWLLVSLSKWEISCRPRLYNIVFCFSAAAVGVFFIRFSFEGASGEKVLIL